MFINSTQGLLIRGKEGRVLATFAVQDLGDVVESYVDGNTRYSQQKEAWIIEWARDLADQICEDESC